MIIPVILSGGTGSRLWPLSRELYPKQLLNLVNPDASLLQETVNRLIGFKEVEAPIVVCNEEHRFMVAEQLRQIAQPAESIILEPVGRNTAPAIAVAALKAMKLSSEAMLLVLPADHAIRKLEAFYKAILYGQQHAQQDRLVTFGIVPDHPETGYGYIKASESLGFSGYKIDCFVEKPDQAMAAGYVAEGGYFWNSGMFMFKAATYLAELQAYAVDIFNAAKQAFDEAKTDLDFLRLDKASFTACPEDSIDYAVMEKTDKGVVIPTDIGWNDVGSWRALAELHASDARGNSQLGDVILRDTENCYLRSEKRLLAAVGVKNLVVVETDDAVLVAHKDKVQDVKKIVEELKSHQRSEYMLHKKVYRPWGSYEGIDEAERFQVKRITVKPGASLSLQMHHHRAEHWIVVKGTARVTCGEKEYLVAENESTYIPLGEQHRLENPGKIPLELIEVQSGSYLGEDDIVRFDDVYGRTQ
ncbi:mannose-1-phosphate guanylyltransferase/mannose-6-phosphate isomerase [Spartinivicinus poritis]|uniref:mannose-1-phosphate guanylyltransferase n=1 Tax=Spartinivicinus poritis TaxID=2994640 RepID=A0ABT5U6T6_9GAMM|nr:mannose-1-phosphate guanylyltransferase/mannose-6-phosphate isomerase [Spartinivicinus sp. A2-2]MDE1460889.1 mannose-1-phosphate guanylyltransferase/mannose-6-phosphate isomerase [Spartinivicinus sp. A2-2]